MVLRVKSQSNSLVGLFMMYKPMFMTVLMMCVHLEIVHGGQLIPEMILAKLLGEMPHLGILLQNIMVLQFVAKLKTILVQLFKVL